jgi:N-acetylglucosamine kinase-like BadF-type ATPase
MTTYFLGVDVGASKSQALIADEHGASLGIGQAGPGNHEGIGMDGFRRVLHQIVDEACGMAGIDRRQIAGAGLGIAGYDWPSDHEPIKAVIDSLNWNARYEFVNDAVIGLVAGSNEGWGVSVVAGTGNNCRGRDLQGREGRVAGVSGWTGEYGGGGDLMRRGVQMVSLAWTKRGPETILTDKFLNHLGARDTLEMIEGLSRGRYHLNQTQAMFIFEAAREGDLVAQDVIRWMGRELAGMAVGVIRQLHFENLDFEVVLTGSLYKGSPLLANTMREVIHEVASGARLVYLNAPPVVGGVMLGMGQLDLDFRAIRPTLLTSAKSALNWVDGAVTED